jgi:predicted small lipoprotein YifL
VRSLTISAALHCHDACPFRSPSAFPDAMADRDNSVHTRSETPQGDDLATPRDPEEKKEKDGRDSEGMFELDS